MSLPVEKLGLSPCPELLELGMGYLHELPDMRDFTPDTATIQPMIAKINLTDALTASLPSCVDLSRWCSPIENQLSIGSCTANAGVALLEFFERKAYGIHIDASRLFLYKATRNLMKVTGDTGAYIRTTLGAMRIFGVPPEEYWPYIITEFDKEPTAFCYSFGQNYRAIKYFRLDPPGISRNSLLQRIKAFIAANFPVVFGFTVYSSIDQASANGKMPYPCKGESVLGGHAIDAVGYDDNIKIKNINACGVETTGALLIRNSWGTGWGDKGYGWLPYEYVLKGLAVDWWSMINADWVNTGEFGI